ncbi:NitT/TauT family transport system substrate-binding protein [Mobilisporobacter senegalensis]|uniref:NitT/TauT family transport system substrate-binding protein n=1 Tax=Mobilisporobacter senegalensis TaxID=1329262 RepID=A0A3N1XV56_9FIRM|nr:MetQ/NlpA family ABC transporter substrate-binding protein [Mobilisporobacter senegalensis]ROR30486.1 NitT/TauT family transport system substrate-binding protein [Mobilisporobacter senegalensis]
MKKIRILLILIVAAFLFTACGNKETADVKKTALTEGSTTSKQVLRIGMMSSSDVIPFVLIKEKGLADKYNIELDLQLFTSAGERDAAFQTGELDGVLTDYIGVCMYQNAGFDVRITGITDGDFILMAGKNTEINNIDDIIGKSIAISQNTLIDYTLDHILLNNNMNSEDVVKEIIPRIPDRLELLRNDKIDLGLMPEPFATLALNDGAIKLGSANEFGLYPAVSAFSKTAIDEKEEAIRNLYIAYNEAVDYMNNTPIKEYEETVIKSVGYPEEMIGKVEVKAFRTSKLPAVEEVEDAIKWASDKGLCSDTLTYDLLTYDVY